jgi:hypothetical protein
MAAGCAASAAATSLQDCHRRRPSVQPDGLINFRMKMLEVRSNFGSQYQSHVLIARILDSQ